MAWELTSKSKVVPVTAKLAKQWSEMREAREDRPLNDRRIIAYREAVRDNAFRPVTWARVFCLETKEWYRVNGKHTSTLFATLDEDDLTGLYAILEDYKCEKLDDVARLYATFDSRMQMRTTADVNKMFAIVSPILASIPPRLINTAVGAIAWYIKPKDPSFGSPQERAERLLEHAEAVRWLGSMIPCDFIRYGHMIRTAVMGAMICSYYRHRDEATKFWSAVRDETGSKPTSPDRKLSRYLLTTKVTGRLMSREVFVKCIHAWNAWRRGADTDLKYFPAAEIPSAR